MPGLPRYGIFVHDPDGDMGYGRIVGQFRGPHAEDRACDRAEQIRRAAYRAGHDNVEAIVLPMYGSEYPIADLVDRLFE